MFLHVDFSAAFGRDHAGQFPGSDGGNRLSQLLGDAVTFCPSTRKPFVFLLIKIN